MQNIISFWQPQRCLSAVLTKHLGNVPAPRFQIGQTVTLKFFSNDPLDVERFMQTFYHQGLIVGQWWDGNGWLYYLHFDRSAWFQKAGYEPHPIPESELQVIGCYRTN